MNPWRCDPLPSRQPQLSYATHLPRVSAAALKRMARVWVGKEASKLNKDACIQAICQGLSDPAAVRRAVDSLSDFERAGLGLLKRYGQSAQTEPLASELLMLGSQFQDDGMGHRSWGARHGADYRALNCLLHRGIALLQDWNHGYSGYPADLSIDDYHYSPQVFSEPCLLARVEPVPPVPLPLEPVDRGRAGYGQTASRSGAAPDRHGRNPAQTGSHPPDEQGPADQAVSE